MGATYHRTMAASLSAAASRHGVFAAHRARTAAAGARRAPKPGMSLRRGVLHHATQLRSSALFCRASAEDAQEAALTSTGGVPPPPTNGSSDSGGGGGGGGDGGDGIPAGAGVLLAGKALEKLPAGSYTQHLCAQHSRRPPLQPCSHVRAPLALPLHLPHAPPTHRHTPLPVAQTWRTLCAAALFRMRSCSATCRWRATRCWRGCCSLGATQGCVWWCVCVCTCACVRACVRARAEVVGAGMAAAVWVRAVVPRPHTHSRACAFTAAC